MGQIDFTNIIVDDFRKGKVNPFNRYVYILTHIHSDHLRGLTNSWNYGTIYCSQITANLITNKFPNLINCIAVLKLEEPTKIVLGENTHAMVTFFDANHCLGAVIVLLEGYFGRFLYTGDFRFDKSKFQKYSYLYPPQDQNPKFQGCSKQIDKLWLDNTFCNPRFKFLTFDDAINIITKFVKQNEHKKIFVRLDNYGKEEVLAHLAKQLDMLIVVDQQRYQTIIAMELDRQLFTTRSDQGRVQIATKLKFMQKLEDNPESLGLNISGWNSYVDWKKVRGFQKERVYNVPYSQHSNYQEIVSFVKSVKPSFIEPIVPLDFISDKSEEIKGTMYDTNGNAESFQELVQKYTSPISQIYYKNLNDQQFQKAVKQRLGLDKKTIQINQSEMSLNTVYAPPRGRGKYKLSIERDEEQISKIKQQCRRSRNKRNREIVINDSDSDSSVRVIEQIQTSSFVFQRSQVRKQKQKGKMTEIQQGIETIEIKQTSHQTKEKANEIEEQALAVNFSDVQKIVISTQKSEIYSHFQQRIRQRISQLQV